MSTTYRNLRILVVDDDLFALDVAVQVLEGLGVGRVTCASSGEDVISLLSENDKKQGFHAIFCDLRMPKMDGMQLFRCISEQGFKGAIAIVSGVDSNVLKTAENLASAHNLNVVGSIPKPIVRGEVEQLLERIVQEQSFQKADYDTANYDRSDVLVGLNSDEFYPVYQPKIDISTGDLHGVEVLARWDSKVYGAVSPVQFIPVMEKNGLIDELFRKMVTCAFSDAKQWKDQHGFQVGLALNVSMENLLDLSLPEYVVDCAAFYGIDPDALILEVTESRLVEDITAAMEILARLRLHQVKLSIDDFGTGYSSMQQLKQLPFTELKIDRSFVTNVNADDAAKAILKSSIDLAKRLGLKIVAEGVESKEDFDLIKSLGCDYAQGFLLSKPLRNCDFVEWYSEQCSLRK